MRDAQAQALSAGATPAGRSGRLGGLRGPQAAVERILGAPTAEGE